MVFCTKCGTQNTEDSSYCAECGASLDKQKQVTSKPGKVSRGEMKEKSEKRPLVAVGLNLLMAGFGMVYVKQYAKAVVCFIIVWIAGTISNLIFGNIFILAIVGYILVIAWTYDETKKYNKNLE